MVVVHRGIEAVRVGLRDVLAIDLRGPRVDPDRARVVAVRMYVCAAYHQMAGAVHQRFERLALASARSGARDASVAWM